MPGIRNRKIFQPSSLPNSSAVSLASIHMAMMLMQGISDRISHTTGSCWPRALNSMYTFTSGMIPIQPGRPSLVKTFQ